MLMGYHMIIIGTSFIFYLQDNMDWYTALSLLPPHCHYFPHLHFHYHAHYAQYLFNHLPHVNPHDFHQLVDVYYHFDLVFLINVHVHALLSNALFYMIIHHYHLNFVASSHHFVINFIIILLNSLIYSCRYISVAII